MNLRSVCLVDRVFDICPGQVKTSFVTGVSRRPEERNTCGQWGQAMSLDHGLDLIVTPVDALIDGRGGPVIEGVRIHVSGGYIASVASEAGASGTNGSRLWMRAA